MTETLQDTALGRRYAAALEFLLSRINYERADAFPYRRLEFRLDRMRELLARLDNPQEAFPIVHVAGTKGKGSTAAMMAAVLTAAGYRTGLNTSPHLEQLEERLVIDGDPCTGEELITLVDRLRAAVEAMDRKIYRVDSTAEDPTYFEITTAMALLHFARRSVDAAVVEVGMGGRLDSTNVVWPRVSVITSISFDHMKQLGPTLASIAREKAGIIKPGVPVVSGVMEDEPRRVIDEVGRQRGSKLVQLGSDFRFTYDPPRALDRFAAMGRMNFHWRETSGDGQLNDLELALLGRHQAANAAVALAALAELRAQGWRLPEPALRRGLAELHWPARVEVVARHPTVVLDAAHNTASIASLLATLDESFSARRRLLVFATTQDKQVAEMLALLLPRFERVIFTRYGNNPRGVPAEQLDALAAPLADVPREICPTPAEAWQRVRALAGPEHLVCVTGSFFLAAEIRSAIGESAIGRSSGG